METIREKIAGIPKDVLVRVTENFQERFRMCVARQSHYIDDKIFETQFKKKPYIM